tara:strand:- start:2491 stop:2805 length:315 start_codon:yes stop_codon:yes gene_type:complete
MNNEKPITLSEAITQMVKLHNLTEKEYNGLIEMEEFKLRVNRNSTTMEQAQQTFSIEAVSGMTATFHIWVLGRMMAKWAGDDWSLDKAPQTLSITAKIDWSNDL